MTQRNREPAKPFEPVQDPAGWIASEMAASGDFLFHLEPAHVAELDAAVKALQDQATPIMEITRDRFPLATLADDLREIRSDITDGRGFVQIRGFPVDQYTKEQSAIAFWGIGMHLGDGVFSQNKKGHVLGHITDIGESVRDRSQRGPYSSDTIPFHVDCCDIVGLLCLRTARAGGESSLASSITVHNEMLKRRPDLVRVLAEPFYRDRRDEVPPGMPPWYSLAVFHYYQGYLSTTVEPTYMGSAHRLDGIPEMTPEQKEALALVQKIAAEQRLDIAFEPGDMQFLNNYVIMHTRQAFEDHPELENRRHLLRLWLKNEGSRPLPEAYFARHGKPDTVDWPGGIVGPDTVPNAPLTPR